MLSAQDIEIIKNIVDPKYFNVDTLIGYLTTHSVIKNEIFMKVVLDQNSDAGRRISDLKYKYSYRPVSVETFIRRIPFYFFFPQNDEDKVAYPWLSLIVRKVVPRSEMSDEELAALLEEKYKALEMIHYHFHISVEDIFAYMDVRERRLPSEWLLEWYDYLLLCEKLHWYDFMPDAFAYKYNLALEASGRDPIIYDLEDQGIAEYVFRMDNYLEIRGNFPVDPAGKPVLRWIGIKLKYPGVITCKLNDNKTTAWLVRIQLTPRTELYARNIYNDEDDDQEQWYRLYAGPLTMEFDYTVLKRYRQSIGMTQKEVAEAVGATLRTYQKWEIGETTPDSKFLLRLLNWLDIKDVMHATKWNDDWCSPEEDEK